jgi:hypothetical protein
VLGFGLHRNLHRYEVMMKVNEKLRVMEEADESMRRPSDEQEADAFVRRIPERGSPEVDDEPTEPEPEPLVALDEEPEWMRDGGGGGGDGGGAGGGGGAAAKEDVGGGGYQPPSQVDSDPFGHNGSGGGDDAPLPAWAL